MKYYKTSLRKAFSLIELSIVIMIVGILIVGVTKGSILISKYRINTAQNITKNSPVAGIKDLALWLEPLMDDSFTGVTNGNSPTDGEKISSWNDINVQASNKINLTQATTSMQPSYTLKGIGNLPTLLFDGGDYLETTLIAIPARYKQYTIFMVWQNSDATGSQVVFHQRSSAVSCTGGDYAGIYLGSNYINTWGCGAAYDIQTISYNINFPYATVYRVDNTQANNVTLYANGTKFGPSATSTLSLGSGGTAVGYGSNNQFYFKGFISEIIVFTRALKDQELNDIRTYLAKKYGFSA